MRLDAYLAQYWPETSRSQWQKHIVSGYVQVNNEVEKSTKRLLGEDDHVTFTLPELPDYSAESLPVIYQDDNVVVINKPTGVLTHSKGAVNEEFTVAEFLRPLTSYHQDSNRPGIVHRLDRDTSGVMIGARNDATASLLQRQFSDRKVKKTYIAILDGIPKEPKATIDLPIGRHPSAPSTFRVDPKGKSAITEYEVLAVKDNKCLVRLKPHTGRTHQLRVHTQYLGTPILGDRFYGKLSKRLFLHAYSLEITIPTSNRQVFNAPLPAEFSELFPNVAL